MLIVTDLKKSFPVKSGRSGRGKAFVHAVDDVSFELMPGEHLGIVGESGSGKTTVARILTDIYRPDQGAIVFLGQDILRASRRQRKECRQSIQMVFQDPYSSLDPRMSVYRLLVEGLTPAPGRYPKRQDKEKRCLEMLEAVGLKREGMLNRYPHEFSGGERQRIAIARSLMLEPKVLILDEAVSSLDVLMQEQILKLLDDLQQKFDITYIFISHNLRVVKKVCRNVIVMHRGKVVESGPVDQVFHHPQHPYTRKLLNAAIHYRAEQA